MALPTDRSVLPLPEPRYPDSTVFDVRNTRPPPRFEVKAPAKAPNVLIVLIDDMGFGQSSAFGGPISMPTVERLANERLRYNQFHTTALCSPTRAALLTGRNHHVNNFGSIAETATAFPGQTGQRPNAVAPLAEMLRLNGYSTAAFGKSHETAAWEVSPSGPTDRWPARPTNGLARRDARAAPRSEALDRQIQGQVRPGLGRAARGDAGSAEAARPRDRSGAVR